MAIAESAIVGAVAGTLANTLADVLSESELEKRIACLDDDMHAFLKKYNSVTKGAYDPPFQKTLVVLGNSQPRTPLPVTSHRYTYLFVGDSTAINAEIPSIGFYDFTLAPGWTEVNFPAGTSINQKTATEVNMIFRAQNYRYTSKAL